MSYAYLIPLQVLPVVAGEALCAAGSLLPNSVAMLKLRSESGTPADFVRYFAADMMPAIRRAMGDRMIVTKPCGENDCGVSEAVR